MLKLPTDGAQQLIIFHLPNRAWDRATGHGRHVGDQLSEAHGRQCAAEFGQTFHQFVVHGGIHGSFYFGVGK